MNLAVFTVSGAQAYSRVPAVAANRRLCFVVSLTLALVCGCGVSGKTNFSSEQANASSPTATPVLTPASGTSGTTSLTVTMSDSTPSATIFYTMDGSTPTASSTSYSSPITITANSTIKAMAMASGYMPSTVASATYAVSAAETAAATPTISPASGTSFASSVSVSISDSTPSATIYYTTNGSVPSTSSSVYSGPITVSASTTVEAVAIANGYQASAVASASYTLSVAQMPAATPIISPASGTSFASSLNVSIVDSTPGATVYYTTNGSTPTTSSSVYSGPIMITAATTVKAIATASGYTQSAVGSTAYTLESAAAGPIISPGSGTSFATSLSVSISDSTPGATIYYTTNGSTPTTSSKVYSGPIMITAASTVKAIATASGYTQSAVSSIAYTLQSATAAPIISPGSGTSFATSLSVSISDSTPGATIYYTTNGSTPTTSSKVYSGPIMITGATTVKAIATANNFTQSGVSSTSYTLQSPAAAPLISPASGTSFASSLSVSIADSTPGATIFYTTNGSTPTTSSSVYLGPITISASSTIQAIAGGSGFTPSGVASANYTSTTGAAGVVSDNLDEPSLNTSLWTLENPLGDGTIAMNGSGVNLNVPMGQNHDLWTTGDNAVRIMQPISNSDFSVDVRFQSAVEVGNQDEGILVEQDAADFVRFDVLFNGTTGPELFAAGINGTNATTFINTQISAAQGPLVLRLARAGNVWTGSWSTDGTNFTSAPSFTFNLNAARIGPYAGASNSTASNSPAFTATVDYFFATSDPIANQDGPKPYGYVTVDANPASTIVEKTLADIQGTGHLEPVIGEEEESQDGDGGESGVYWYEYPASGNVNDPWIKHTIIASGDAYEDMVAFDVNGDGAVDIICSFDPTFSQNWGFVWFENPRGSGGNPATDPWVEHVIGPGLGENNLVMADIDGDGKIDLVSPSSVYFQNSPDSWTQMQYSTSFRGVALLDIGSGNGAIDLGGTQPVSPFNAVWWENPRETGGNARTGKWIMHTIGPGYPCSADNCDPATGLEPAAYNSVDVNGDGRMDIISSQSEGPGGGIAPPPGGVLWWEAPADRRNGTWISHLMDFSMLDVHKISVGDMDKNGTPDIIVDEQDQSLLDRVVVFYNDGKGNLTEQTISNGKGHNDDIGDVIGNGSLDILSSGHGFFNDSHPLRIFLNPY
jgi:hypothetical protein